MDWGDQTDYPGNRVFLTGRVVRNSRLTSFSEGFFRPPFFFYPKILFLCYAMGFLLTSRFAEDKVNISKSPHYKIKISINLEWPLRRETTQTEQTVAKSYHSSLAGPSKMINALSLAANNPPVTSHLTQQDGHHRPESSITH
ncbi:hypothetical protein CDAR_436511 [Caerostris darwini]|uniref:Uncharacterized protein n=1 Tax=Caerostris darwini TaxID=1538125 RepID=A0AAV4R436_9ARAC|nr:hypothetical protein CDAR_436511 [Caerostris darwini]